MVRDTICKQRVISIFCSMILCIKEGRKLLALFVCLLSSSFSAVVAVNENVVVVVAVFSFLLSD